MNYGHILRVALLMLVIAGEGVTSESPLSQPSLNSTDVSNGCLEEFVEQGKRLPLILLEELGQDLSKTLYDASVCRELHEDDRILQKNTTHELRSVRGRAAWALERLFHIHLPSMRLDSEQQSIDAARVASLHALAVLVSVMEAQSVQQLCLEDRKSKAASPTASPSELDGLSLDRVADVRKLVAENQNVRMTTLWRLEHDPDPRVRLVVLDNPVYTEASTEEQERYLQRTRDAMQELLGNEGLEEHFRKQVAAASHQARAFDGQLKNTGLVVDAIAPVVVQSREDEAIGRSNTLAVVEGDQEPIKVAPVEAPEPEKQKRGFALPLLIGLVAVLAYAATWLIRRRA